MKIIHLPSTFFPDHTGGKEQFVSQLVQNLPRHQHIVVVHHADERKSYIHKGIRVEVLPQLKTSNYRYSYFSLRFDGLEEFGRLLDEVRPDVVHFHDQSSGASLSHLDLVKSKGIKTLLTYHSPGQSSMQRALIRNGEEPCDGVIDLTRCTVCRYRSSGLPAPLAAIAGLVSLPAVDGTGKFMFRKSTALYLNMWREFYSKVDAIQVHAPWVKEMLVGNKVAEKKIHLLQMGGTRSIPSGAIKYSAQRSLRLVFVGRCTDIKGVHLLVDAVKSLAASDIEVHFFGPGWDDDYGKMIRSKVGDDRRFQQPVLLDPDKVGEHVAGMDVAVIPSLWPETGPFTLFDAFAVRVPVIGTRHAGIMEKCRENIDSLLFNWGDAADLASKISAVYHDRELLAKLRSNIRDNRPFSDFAEDIGHVYEKIGAA
jgi:glycosyltransferase involved in cell wall biosynthesis